MHRYRYKEKEYQNPGYKIRLIKEDLANSVKLSSSNLILVYRNMILEDCERIIHYEIDKKDFIWFGTKDDYDGEFGQHLIITIKADECYESIDISEKLLVKSTYKIVHIRNILGRIYKWITKVKFLNVNRNKLSDDQLIEECQLIENPFIIIGSPEFKVDRGNLDELQSNLRYFGGTRLRLNPFEMSPLMEILKLMTDKTNRNRSFLSIFMDLIKLENPEDVNIKHDTELFLCDWTKYYDRADRNQLSIEDKTSIYRQDYSDNLNDVTDEVEIGTADEHYQVMLSLYQVGVQFIEKYFPTPFDNLKNSLAPIFEAYSKSRDLNLNNDKFADLRLGRRLTFFFKRFLDNGYRLNDNEFNVQFILILPDLLQILQKINSLIMNYWTQINYSGTNSFKKLYVHTNLEKDRPCIIFTPADMTAGQTRKILSDSNPEKEVFLASSDFTQFYKDSEIMPSEENICAITVSKFKQIKDWKFIGGGGYAEVYTNELYTNELTGKQNVLKQLVLPSNKSLDEVNEVLREIITFSQIAPHRRIMQFTDYFIEDGKFYIEMEFMKNGSLKSFLEHNGRLNETQIKHFSSQILEGLEYLHSKSICHRDIKAANVLLDDDNNAKLSDFGLANWFHEATDDLIRGIKQSTNGTMKWMAPEVFTGNYGSPADIWSFGITMIEMITGKDPFPDINYKEIYNRIKKYGNKSLKKEVSDNLFTLLDKCLQFDPKDRPMCQKLLEYDFFK